MDLTPRIATLVALCALIPGLLFAITRREPFVAIALVNVVLIVASLYIAFSPVPDTVHGQNGYNTAG